MEEMEAEIKRNIKKITIDTSYHSPVKKKDISTINESGYNEPDYQVGKISDSNEQVDASSISSTDSAEQVDPNSNPRVDTHITDVIQKLLINQIPVSFYPVIIVQDFVTSVQETSREGLLWESSKLLQTISLKDIRTGAARESGHVERIVQTPSRAICNSPGVNVEVFIPSRCSHSSIAKWSRNINPFNTYADGSLAQEINLTSFYTYKISVKRLPGEVITDLDPSKRMNFTSSVFG